MPEIGPAQTPEGWDKVAEGYAHYIEPDLAPYSKRALEHLPVGEGDRVLDVACGPGPLALSAAKEGADVVGVDFSPAQVKILKQRAQAEGVANLDARVMDGQALDLPDASFDAGFSMFGVMLFPEREKGFAELHRVLDAGGRAAVSSWVDPSKIEWLSLFREAIEAAVPDLPRLPEPPFMPLTDPDRLETEMREGGFEDVEIHTIEEPMQAESADVTWRKLAEANPVLPAIIDQLGHDAITEIRRCFKEIYVQRYGEGPATMDSAAYLAIGTRR